MRQNWWRDIRAADPQALTGLAGTRLAMGGVPAFNVDYEDAIKHSLGEIVASVVCATLLVLVPGVFAACSFH